MATCSYYLETPTLELLRQSSVLMEKWSETECRTKSKGGMEEWAKDRKFDESTDCSWYHGTWQYLRLLDMVAVPGWHADFYQESLSSVLRKKPSCDVLISAAADYGMLATLHRAIEATQTNPNVIVYDICKTPLTSCQWYADRHGLRIQTRIGNLITGDVPEAPFDLIVTDEFLTVLKSEYKPLITRRWKELLKPGGSVVTVAMKGGITTPVLRQKYAERADALLGSRTDEYVSDLQNGRKADIIRRFKIFSEFHTRHMIVEEKELRGLFAEFDQLSCRRITTPGECVNPTDSFQIVASVKE